MGSLYHIKAKGYSARIQRQYIDAIKKSIEHSKKRRNCESDIETVVQSIQCLSPAKKYKLYKSSINKSIHFAQRSLSSSTRGQRVTAQLNLSRE